MTKYEALSDSEKIKLLTQEYGSRNRSFPDIASDYDTYANKLRRDALKFKIPIRDRSEAQKNALATGRHKHPTKGTTRSEETKQKIGASVLTFWEDMSEDELEIRKKKFKEQWDKLSDEDRKAMQQAANEAVRLASKNGSKLEKFMFSGLVEAGYRVEFHKEESLVNTRLQIDLFLPELKTAIEIDGPSHFLPVWGEQTLKRNKTYDSKKEGLLLGKGLALIRVKQTKDFSNTRGLIVLEKVKEQLEKIKDKFPDQGNRNFLIED
jgi:very-short-patch-repair endonuclease